MTETEAALRTLAHNVRAARTRAGLSLDELGRRAKVSKGALVALEKAQGNPNFATLVRLADTLGISVSALTDRFRMSLAAGLVLRDLGRQCVRSAC